MTEAKSKKNESALARGTFYWADPDELIIIGLDTKDGTEHPLYDPRIHAEIPESEVNNVEYYGVKKTVYARRIAGRLEVVDGRGRVRKARLVKQRQIKKGEETIRVPVLIEKGDDAHLFGLSRALNIHKADGPMTTAKNVQRLLSMGKTIGEVATTFGVSEQTIRNYQAMLDLDPAVIEATIKEEISSTAAIQLAQLPKADQKEVLADIQKETKETGAKPTVERVKKKVAEKQGKQSKTPKDRIERAKNVLLKYAIKPAGEKTKEEMAATLERVCRLLTDAGLDKLAATEEE